MRNKLCLSVDLKVLSPFQASPAVWPPLPASEPWSQLLTRCPGPPVLPGPGSPQHGGSRPAALKGSNSTYKSAGSGSGSESSPRRRGGVWSQESGGAADRAQLSRNWLSKRGLTLPSGCFRGSKRIAPGFSRRGCGRSRLEAQRGRVVPGQRLGARLQVPRGLAQQGQGAPPESLGSHWPPITQVPARLWRGDKDFFNVPHRPHPAPPRPVDVGV